MYYVTVTKRTPPPPPTPTPTPSLPRHENKQIWGRTKDKTNATNEITDAQTKNITKTCLFKYTKNFTTKKWKFSDKKKSDIFHISAQNIDCYYSLEPPRRCGSNKFPQYMFWAEIRKIMYTSVNPSFTIWKLDLRGSKLYRHVFVINCNKGTGLEFSW